MSSALKAIRRKCVDCCCGQLKEIKLCPAEECALWAFRFGKYPKTRKTENSTETPEKCGDFFEIEKVR